MWTGRRIADRFEVEAQVGEGGMGVVFVAHDLQTGRKVALKVLRGVEGDDDAEARFAREATVLAELRHPGIVRYVAHGRTTPGPTGDPFLAMQWLEGVDLVTRLASEGLGVRDTVRLARRVADALSYAHGRGVVHRDLKPSNLFLVEGEVESMRVLDFGLARKWLDRRALTRTGSCFGTPGYLAPEQALGASTIGPPADVFSLGCILYECLAGASPFAAEDPVVALGKVLSERPPDLGAVRPDLPSALVSLVTAMLARDPAQRPADGRAVLDALDALGEVDDGPRPRRSAPPPALTAGEQRVSTAVLVASPSPALASFLERFGPLAVDVEDGTLAVFQQTSSRASATDLVSDGARFALSVRAAIPDAALAIVTGRASSADATGGSGALFERARTLLGSGPGEGIPVDDLTAGLLGRAFDVAHEGARAVLRGPRARREPGGTVRSRESPCVGRERELAILQSTLAECVEERAARVVQITGAPGLGKSRLGDELLRRVARDRRAGSRARIEDVDPWIGRADPMRTTAPYALVAELLRDALGLIEADPVAERRARVFAGVSDVVTTADDVERIASFLAEVLGLGSVPGSDDDDAPVQLRAARRDPQLFADQVRRAFEDFVAARASARPLLLVLDDLQWGDAASVRLLDVALRRASELPILAVVLARPEIDASFPDLFAGRARVSLALTELGPRACGALVRAILGDDVPEPRVAKLVERSGGNPLWLEELLRAGGDADAAAGRAETVLAIVQARVEALGADARRVLRAASVFGRTFWEHGVLALLGVREGAASEGLRIDDVRGILDDLVASETLVDRGGGRGEGRFAGVRELVFRHALVRDAAYAMLTESDRALGHALAARWLEAVGETDAALLAEHYARGGDGARGAWWSLRAAEQALDANDLAGVEAHVARGVAIGAEGALLGALDQVRAQALRWAGDNAATLAAAERAVAALPPGTARWFEALGDAGVASSRLARTEALEAWAELLRDTVVSEDAGDEDRALAGSDALASRLVASCRVAIELQHGGRRALAEGLVACIEREGARLVAEDPAIAATFAHVRAVAAMSSGDPSATVHWLSEAARAFDEAGDLRHECLELGNLGYMQIELGRPEAAEPSLRDALIGADRMGLVLLEGGIRANLALSLIRLGRFDEARDEASRAVALSRARGNVRIGGAAQLYLAMAEIALGRGDAADGALRGALESFEAVPSYRAYALAVRARLSLARGELSEAERDAREAAGILAAEGALEAGEGLVRLVEIEVLEALGRGDEARARTASALARLHDRARAIADEDLRRDFLQGVPEHAALLARGATGRG